MLESDHHTVGLLGCLLIHSDQLTNISSTKPGEIYIQCMGTVFFGMLGGMWHVKKDMRVSHRWKRSKLACLRVTITRLAAGLSTDPQ